MHKTECLAQKFEKSNFLVLFLVATEKKNKEEGEESTVAVPAKKPKPAAKAAAVAKPLRQMMEEDVIPPLQAILESQDDISDIDLSFQDDKLEGFFLKKSIPYSFWAFFPTGNLTGEVLNLLLETLVTENFNGTLCLLVCCLKQEQKDFQFPHTGQVRAPWNHFLSTRGNQLRTTLCFGSRSVLLHKGSSPFGTNEVFVHL